MPPLGTFKKYFFRPAAALTLATIVAIGSAGPAGAISQSQIDFANAKDAATDSLDQLLQHPISDADREFFTSTKGKNLADLAPGTIVDTRDLTYHIASFEVPLRVTQVSYRTTDSLDRPSLGITSVIHPPGPANGNIVSYQSAYDSLNPDHGPSRVIAGGFSLGSAAASAETAVIAPFLANGTTVLMPDTEGQTANFAAGPEYGMVTLDSMRAARQLGTDGLSTESRFALFGYSGGSIASGWAAILLNDYAPELRPYAVGVAQGGTLVNPLNNLAYAIKSPVWNGVVGMAVIGLARAYDIDMSPYLTPFGADLVNKKQYASILEGLGAAPGRGWSDLVLPEYPTPESIEPIREIGAKINMGTAPIPDIPMLLAQGGGGWLEMTPPGGENIGLGDGIMILADARQLATRYCEAGTPMMYREYEMLDHIMAGALWGAEAYGWVSDRFAGLPAPNNCGTYPAGNDLTRTGTGGEGPVGSAVLFGS